MRRHLDRLLRDDKLLHDEYLEELRQADREYDDLFDTPDCHDDPDEGDD